MHIAKKFDIIVMLKNKEHGAKRFRTVLGGIAQLARVLGSYPIGHWFESSCRYHDKP